MEKPYLVQRASFRKEPRTDKIGIDKILEFDYMGSAEFEWGALPKSLRRIHEGLVVEGQEFDFRHPDCYYETSCVVINGVDFYILTPKGTTDQVARFIDQLGKREIRTKERTDLPKVLGYEKSSLPTRTNFWWDIDNDWMAFLADKKVNTYRIFLNAMVEGHYKFLERQANENK